MDYVTRGGLRIQVGRIDRRLLDNIAIPEPQPPLREVETWGGVVEQVPTYEDAGYRDALLHYRLELWSHQLAILSAGITLPDRLLRRAGTQLEALTTVLDLGDTKTTFLRYHLENDDRAMLIELILYLSTVTQRGVQEAVALFGYKWRGKPLGAWHIPSSWGERGMLAVEWHTALRSGLTWLQFCQLTGPEQSQHVAFWLLEDKLQYLINTQK